jgi:hypothetical protein
VSAAPGCGTHTSILQFEGSTVFVKALEKLAVFVDVRTAFLFTCSSLFVR